MQKSLLENQGQLNSGRYEIIRVIGRGGFGITYVAKDTKLEQSVVIKEYYPSHIAQRQNDGTVFSPDEDMFLKGRTRFLDEAKVLASVFEVDGVVKILDYFEENNTAYMVMEHVKGMSLRDHLERSETGMSFDDALGRMLPVMASLEKIHEKGLIHRDINPDNIMVLEDGSLKLLDFGSAREFFMEQDRQKTMSVLVKSGYAPPEQYDSHGNQGPWVDVYSICATIYEMITGCVPEDSSKRMMKDTLYPPSAFGAAITPDQEELLMNRGLAVSVKNRFQSMKEMENAFFPEITDKNNAGKNRFRLAALAAAAMLLIFTAFFTAGHLRTEFAGNYPRGSKEYEKFMKFVRENAVEKHTKKKGYHTEAATVYTLEENAVKKIGIPANRTTIDQTREELIQYFKEQGIDTKISNRSSSYTVTEEKYDVIRTSFAVTEMLDSGKKDRPSISYEYDLFSEKIYCVHFYVYSVSDMKEYEQAADYLCTFGFGTPKTDKNKKEITEFLMTYSKGFMKNSKKGESLRSGYSLHLGVEKQNAGKNVMSINIYPVDFEGVYQPTNW